ncbi:hypothetical protein B4U80_11918, partial [Leptotrombidium deliense]
MREANREQKRMIAFEEQLIDDWKEVFNDITASKFDTELHDILFLCEETVFTGNKLIFQTVSPYWNNRFSAQKDVLIELTDVKSEHFAQILEYIYTGKIKFETLENAVPLVLLVKQYELDRLHHDILDIIQSFVNLENIWHLFQVPELTEDVEEMFLVFLDNNATVTVKRAEMLNLSHDIFEKLIKRDTFSAKETEIFEMTKNWLQKNPIHRQVIRHIRFAFMSRDEQENIMRESNGLVTRHDITLSINSHRPRSTASKFLFMFDTNQQWTYAQNISVKILRLCDKSVVQLPYDRNEKHFVLPYGYENDDVLSKFDFVSIDLQIPLMRINALQMILVNDETSSQEFIYEVFAAVNPFPFQRVAWIMDDCTRGLQVLFFEDIPVDVISIVGHKWKNKGKSKMPWFSYATNRLNKSKILIGFTERPMATYENILIPNDYDVISHFWGAIIFVANKKTKTLILEEEASIQSKQ